MERAVNIARARHVIRATAAVLIGVTLAGVPALVYAQHMGGTGGGHVSTGGAGHMGGGHVGAGHFGGGPVMGAGPRYAGAPRVGGVGYAGGHVARPGFAPGHVGYGGVHVGSPGYAHGNGYWHGTPVYHGNGNAYWHGGHYWGGGYWHGGYWPHVWYYPGFAWYYPVLPIGYATFWWGGSPYYYYNNLYYTWNPGYNGYVVTDPPPAAGEDSGDGSAETAAPGSAPSDYGPSGGAGADVYVYPRNGQSDQQTSTDRFECHTWAVTQTGFDPTRSAPSGTGSSAEYRRAMVACLDARGYSAR